MIVWEFSRTSLASGSYVRKVLVVSIAIRFNQGFAIIKISLTISSEALTASGSCYTQ